MKNWMLALLIFLAGLFLTGCATTQTSSNDTAVNDTTIAVNNNPPSVPDKAEQNQLLSFWKKMPSTQWFINDSTPTVG